MFKKKCKKILRSCCFLVVCCVILAGAAAPLTAYAAEDDGSAALDVAQETRTLSGTWTFNDVISLDGVSSALNQDVYFQTVPSEFSVDGETFEYTYAKIAFLTEEGETALVYLSSNPFAMHPVYADLGGIYWNVFAESNDDPTLTGYGQTITFLEEQEVSVEFYDWFTANAVKQEMPADNLLESIFSAIRAPLSWVGSVLGALISGPMSELLPLFAVFIAISVIFVVVVLVKKNIWGG